MGKMKLAAIAVFVVAGSLANAQQAPPQISCHSYCGTEPNTNAMFVIFGVAEVGKAVKVFEQAAAASPGG